MLCLDEARLLLLEGVDALPAEELPIGACVDRVLAEDTVATRDQPPSPVSAMDGYALHREDATPGAMLRVIGGSPAGDPFIGSVGRGEAVRIATGGVVPEGADHVVIQESVSREDDQIRINEIPSSNAFIRKRGCDFMAGDPLARAGDVLTPARIGLLAAASIGSVHVHRRPRVIVLPSGDELREPGIPLEGGQIANSAAYAVAALTVQWGAEPDQGEILPDDPELLRRALATADLSADVIVTIGGASVGERDSLPAAFERFGAGIRFHRVAIQPGKPVWHARFPDGRAVLGLPGNPTSAFVCSILFLKPLIFARLGRNVSAAMRTVGARLGKPLPANGERESFLRAGICVGPDGTIVASADDRQDSGLWTPLASARALIRRPSRASAAPAGDQVEILPIGECV
jgi:molybdopterin molybdotransferase